MLPKAGLVPKAELVPAKEEPKSEVEEPKAGAEELEPNTEPVEAPKSEVVDVLEPKGLDEAVVNGELKSEVDVEPNPDEPKLGDLSAKGLEDVVEEKTLGPD